MDLTKPSEFKWFGDVDGPKLCKFIGFQCPPPCPGGLTPNNYTGTDPQKPPERWWSRRDVRAYRTKLGPSEPLPETTGGQSGTIRRSTFALATAINLTTMFVNLKPYVILTNTNMLPNDLHAQVCPT